MTAPLWVHKLSARELPSPVGNDRYPLSCTQMEVMAAVYDPERRHATDPSCWPHHATGGDLRGRPSHIISVNEVDPLRDEGLAYHNKLAAAGVASGVRTVPGACHSTDLALVGRQYWPPVPLGTAVSPHRPS